MYLADTHSLCWYFTEDKRLSSRALKIFASSEKGRFKILIPTIVLAEIFYISEKRKIKISFEKVLDRIGQGTNFEIIDLNLEVIEELKNIGDTLEMHDRIILATAKLYSAIILTKDKEIKNLGEIETVW